MKGYCPKCGEVIDEVEFTQFGKCEECYAKVSFYNSIPIENLTPEQRKRFKKVMRKEVSL